MERQDTGHLTLTEMAERTGLSLDTLRSLRTTGMPIARMQQFPELCRVPGPKRSAWTCWSSTTTTSWTRSPNCSGHSG